MSYRAGATHAAARVLGIVPGGPRIVCDRCGVVRTIPEDRPPPEWFLAGRPVPGWRLERPDPDHRRDYCPRCKEAPNV